MKTGDRPKRLILCTVPTNRCNLHCKYCYITQMDEWDKSSKKFQYSVDTMVKALSKQRLGGISIINLTGIGETLLQPEIEKLIVGLAGEGHYIEVVTNATVSTVIRRLTALPKEISEKIMYKISFHYDELIRLHMFDKFWENVNMIKNSPSSFTLELMPCDELEDKIDEIIKICEEKVKAKCHLTIGRKDSSLNRGILTEHDDKKYFDIWSKFDSEMFRVKKKLVNIKRREFCYAGNWTLCVDLASGDARQCYGQPVFQNIFKNINRKIKFIPVGYCCAEPYCINGHALLTWGCIPELDIPSYNAVRDRVSDDGEHWLKMKWQGFSSHKLEESNRKYTKGNKFGNTIIKPLVYAYGFMFRPAVIFNNIKKFFKKLISNGKLT